MDRNGIQKVLRDLVMGHRTAGMEGVYAHIAPETRAALMTADDRNWRDARLALSPTSPVPVLDALLAAYREGREAAALPSALPQTPKGDSRNPGNRL
jgi:hypothetical protein